MPSLHTILISFLLVGSLVLSCKQKEEPPLPTGSAITATPTVTGLSSATVTADAGGSNYTVTLPAGTSVKALQLTISLSPGATIDPKPEIARDYTSPVTYTITKADNSRQSVIITVLVQSGVKSAEKQITVFALLGISPTVQASIDQATHKITATVSAANDLTKLAPTVLVSSKATVSPASGVTQNFTNPVNYIVTAEDGSKQSYEVTIKQGISASGLDALYFSSVKVDEKGNYTFMFYALDAATGKEIWTYIPTNVYYSPLGASVTYPIAINGNVLTTFGGDVYQFNAATGERYSSKIRSSTTQNVYPYGAPAADNNYIVYTATLTHAYGLVPKTQSGGFIVGEEKWAYPKFGDPNPAGPKSNAITADGILYFGLNNLVYALDIASGALKWKFTGKSDVYKQEFIANPCLYNGILYAPSDGYYGGLSAIDAKTGVLKWKSDIADEFGAPTAFNNVVYMTSSKGLLYAFDAQTGVIKWKNENAGGLISVVNNEVFCIYGDNKITVFNADTGQKKREISLDEKLIGLSSKLVIVNGVLYRSTGYGNIVPTSDVDYVAAFDLVTGQKKWKIKVSNPSNLCLINKGGKPYYDLSSGMQQ